MSSGPKYAAVFWFEENQHSVVSVSCITKPRKEAWEYVPGERVTAKYQQKPYPAEILKLGDDKSQLLKDGDKILDQKRATSCKDNAQPKKGSGTPLQKNVETPQQRKVGCQKPNDDVSEIQQASSSVEQVDPQSSTVDNTATVNYFQRQFSDPGVSSSDKEASISLDKDVQIRQTEVARTPSRENSRGNSSNMCNRCRDHCRCRDISYLKEKVRKLEEMLKTHIQDCGGSTGKSTASIQRPGSTQEVASVSNSESQSEHEELMASVSHLKDTDVVMVVKTLANKLFTKEELKLKSYSGKRTVQARGEARPPLDPQKIKLLETVGLKKTKIDRTLFVSKFSNYQKQLRREIQNN